MTNLSARTLGGLCFLLAFTLLAYLFLDYWRFHQLPLREKLQVLWEQDIKRLKEADQLPPQWAHIQEVEFFGGSDEAREWVSQLSAPLHVNREGDHKLEVLLLIWREEERTGAILQHNLVDLKSENMIWELGRTFTLDQGSTWKNMTQNFSAPWETHDGETPELVRAIQAGIKAQEEKAKAPAPQKQDQVPSEKTGQ